MATWKGRKTWFHSSGSKKMKISQIVQQRISCIKICKSGMFALLVYELEHLIDCAGEVTTTAWACHNGNLEIESDPWDTAISTFSADEHQTWCIFRTKHPILQVRPCSEKHFWRRIFLFALNWGTIWSFFGLFRVQWQLPLNENHPESPKMSVEWPKHSSKRCLFQWPSNGGLVDL